MDSVQFLIRGFEYDLWANQKWLGAISGFRQFDRVQQVMEHILYAQGTWLERCGAWVPVQEDNLDMRTVFEVYARSWIALVEASDLDSPITYTTSTGNQFTQSIGDIALHVINHGTYHRGQLRGIADSDGHAGFPETDLILFLRDRGS